MRRDRKGLKLFLLDKLILKCALVTGCILGMWGVHRVPRGFSMHLQNTQTEREGIGAGAREIQVDARELQLSVASGGNHLWVLSPSLSSDVV